VTGDTCDDDDDNDTVLDTGRQLPLTVERGSARQRPDDTGDACDGDDDGDGVADSVDVTARCR
jgi:hypothetical protein